jgi:riboflavin biosynthesis pyrimidine reductase
MADSSRALDSEIEGGEKVTDPVLSDIRQHSWVLRGINEILRDNPQLTFTPEDIFVACVQGEARLWTTDEGMVVTTGITDVYTGERSLLIWLAWAKERGKNLVQIHQDFFIEQARLGGFRKLEVRSAVVELKDYILASGWQLDTIVYTRDVYG